MVEKYLLNVIPAPFILVQFVINFQPQIGPVDDHCTAYVCEVLETLRTYNFQLLTRIHQEKSIQHLILHYDLRWN